MTSSPISLTATLERWPIAGSFTISRGAKTEAAVIVAELSLVDRPDVKGRGECVPYPRYGETPEGVLAAIGAVSERLRKGLTRRELQSTMPAGAARNAIDCALWDLEAKAVGRRAFEMIGLTPPQPLTTAYTISLGTPEAMADATARAAHRPLLKIKLGGEGDVTRIAAVRAAAPKSTLIVDANEAWTGADLERHLDACATAGVTLVEQPLPAGQDALLGRIQRPIAVCADESVHDRPSLEGLRERYDAINIKLDKTGGLTEALAMSEAARALGFQIMVGCMVATSLSMAPAVLVAQHASVVDLDGPLLLAKDRENGLRYDGSTVYPPEASLWG